MESDIGWFEGFIIMVVVYLMFPCWIYIVFKMATMGIFDGILNALKNKGEIENDEKQET